MTVFKTYLKIVKKFLPTIIMYTGIFMFFAVMTTSSNSMNGFSASKPKISLEVNDSSILVDDFKKYIEKNTNIIEVKGSVEDALFYQDIDEIIIIPENYTNDLLNKKEVNIEVKNLGSLGNASYNEMVLNKYINLTKIYLESGHSLEETIKLVNDNLSTNTEIVMSSNVKTNLDKAVNFFNFSNYTILAVLILIIGSILSAFKNIKRRNDVSSMSYNKLNRELFLGNLCLSLCIWLAYIIGACILYKDVMLSINGLLLIINSLAFSIFALSLGFFLGNIVTNRNAQNGIVNIIALGSSFLCGAFVPQEYLGDTVNKIATVLPSSWFIKNNTLIGTITSFDVNSITNYIINIMVVIISTIIIFMFTNYVSKKRLQK